MPTKKKNEDKKPPKKQGGKKPEIQQDDDIKEISVEEAIELLGLGDGKKKGGKKFDKNLSIEERNKIDDSQFLFKCGRYVWVTKRANCESIRLNDKNGMFAFGLASLGERIVLLHDSMDKEFALDTFTHEVTHCVLFGFPDIFEETEGGGVSDEYLCEFVSGNIEDIWKIREEFKKSAFYKTFKDREI